MIIPSIDYMLDEAAKNNQAMWQIVLREEQAGSGITQEEIRRKIARTYEVMKEAATNGISSDLKSISGMTGGDAARYYKHCKNRKNLLGTLSARAMAYALATSEYNASMGVIVAAPTAGAAGILPGVLMAAQEEYGFADREVVNALLTAGGIGAAIATRATLSGAQGGCQAECGSGAAMAAAALCELMGGTSRQISHAMALALKNLLGLACDPVAGLVEVPCVKRNGLCAILAIAATDMALAGIESVIPPDEVIDAMYAIGTSMPACIRETAEGGLAATPTGAAAKRRLL